METNSQGALTIKKGVEPTSSTADQLTIFATTDSSTTLGIRSEQTVATETLTPDSSYTVRINGTLYKIPLEAIP